METQVHADGSLASAAHGAAQVGGRGVVLKRLRRVSAENQKLQKRTSRNAGAKNEKHDI